MANRILGDEFEQSWITKVVAALENDVLMHDIRMLLQVGPQSRYIACIEKIHGATKGGLFNSLIVPQIQTIGERWSFNVFFQPRPAWKSIFARDN